MTLLDADKRKALAEAKARVKEPCSVDACGRPTIARGLCGRHYQRWKVHGDPLFTLPPSAPPRAKAKPVKERILARSVIEANGCWAWKGTINRIGYGHMVIAKRSWLAHRASYEAFVGPIPAGLTLDHLCRNRACVNPAHLEPVTNRENCLRGEGFSAVNARKTHCKHGHPFTGDNYRTYSWGRCCMVCVRIRNAARPRRTEAVAP